MQPTQSAGARGAAADATYRCARASSTLRQLQEAASDVSVFRGNGATALEHLP